MIQFPLDLEDRWRRERRLTTNPRKQNRKPVSQGDLIRHMAPPLPRVRVRLQRNHLGSRQCLCRAVLSQFPHSPCHQIPVIVFLLVSRLVSLIETEILERPCHRRHKVVQYQTSGIRGRRIQG